MSRASGRSSVAAAAYRAAEKLENQRDGLVHDFSRRSGVEHAEIVLPEGANAEWAKDRSGLWNAAEASEKRRDARVAREIEVALPHELSAEQRLELTREFAQGLADRYGVAVDFAIHSPHGHTDIRNHHAHIMMTTRKLGPEGLGEKSELELENKRLVALGLPTSHEQLRDIRIGWEERTNEHLARAGLEMRIDHRSHQERGLEIEPTQHMGVHATQMERRGKDVSRVRIDEEAAKRNAELIREKPEQVLTLITNEKSVFDRHDVARTLHRYIGEADAFQAAFAKVMASPALVELQAEQRDEHGRVIEQARYSTREMVSIERDMAISADRMVAGRSFSVSERRIAAALARQDDGIQRAGGAGLSGEQRAAIEHVTGPERIAAVVGLAGAGKSTMLAAAREAWEAKGYHVHGAALAGKAAEGLEESAGIASRTLASWERGWERGFDQLGPRDVFVIDEAGMVGSKQLSRFIQEADRAGAKIVLVGDPEQLQPIGPGAAFRAVAERVGFVELEEIRRQREGWQREASVDFGRHRTAEGLAAYAERGAIRLEETASQARDAIVRDVAADMEARPDGSRLVLAHRNVDVQALNEAIRAVRQERGELDGERVYRTTEGVRAFAPGDRLLFRENNRELGVKNGMLATVDRAEDGRLGVRLDSAQGPGQGRAVSVSMEDYAAVDHGYATTIHKAQGATVDRAYVLASGTMDRHLTYVAMTRHRDGVQLYAGRDEFSDVGALSARLSRSQAKETTLDYDQAAYARRRGIESDIIVPAAMRERPARERAAEHGMEPTAEPPARKRGMFDGLKLNTGRVMQPEAQRDASRASGFEGLRLPAQERAPEPVRQREAPDLTRAVDRYARAWTDAAKMRAQDLPILQHHKVALRDAGVALDVARPGGTRDLLTALEHEPATYKAMTQMQGRERAAQLVAGIEREARVRQVPEMKAARLVKVWNGLEAERDGLRGWDQAEARGKVEARMKSLAGELKRDPQLESLIRSRQRELGIAPGSGLDRVMRERDIDRAMEHGIRRDRDRGMGIGM
ncbi:Conjugal transfer protein (plasmid) [Xanthomonas citri subsp. citri Aw12879]|nr:Conjugal transfer protein [Xanthomonas citri subsp. citri Aw12879]AJZ42176.1 Ti-type conjugative transfer relaxase TraA [Xanthomonas citri pv. citri]AJZ46791.1 Ti-type conjugative transfer relaxase TraA [Xanthomonas citri pv. citri]AJZ51411.1 Ti-type conjugative transfer relaxase TraA [Xanthomonas citri pv. citri]AJZ64206.1 Ti-type conjugative transfer relaxase TraA [Xanthomonas citri pv. citri]